MHFNSQGIFSAENLAERIFSGLAERGIVPVFPLEPKVLARLLEVALYTSLLHEELRPLSFRLGLLPQRLSNTRDPSLDRISIHRFSVARPFSVEELRKLALASSFSRSLLGIAVDEDGELKIDGILQTGPLWLRAQQGGRGGDKSIFPGLSIHVLGAGNIEIIFAGTPIAAFHKGVEHQRRLNVFQAAWLRKRFEHFRRELLELSEAEAATPDGTEKVALDPMFFGQLTQQMLKRMIAAIRAANHGGTVLLIPSELQDLTSTENPDLRVRASFASSPARARHRALMLDAARLLRSLGGGILTRTAGWDEYAQMSDPALDLIDNALFEESHFIAALANTDGAVVLNDRFEVLGFGAEILCHEMEVPFVTRALDVDGEFVEQESVEHVGTRHRSSYRFVAKHSGALALVVSQDGAVRLVINRNGQVLCFEHDDLSVSNFVL